MSEGKSFGSLPLLEAATHLIGLGSSMSAGRIPTEMFVKAIVVPSGGDLDELLPPKGHIHAYVLQGGHAHAPEGCNPNGALLLAASHGNIHGVQLMVPLFNATGIAFRGMNAGTWGSWRLITGSVVATNP